MKCSLLTLSTFIDGELAPQRRAEVDAHLVGCPRCNAGVTTLREEKVRVAQLARVHVDPASAQLMLEQVGITVDSVVDGAPAIPPPPAPADAQRPWQAGKSSPALPWTPLRPTPAPLATAAASEGPVPADLQPDLPLTGLRSAPESWDRPAAEDAAAPVEVEASSAHPDPPTPPEAGPAEADDEWFGSDQPEAWEADLPPLTDSAPEHEPAAHTAPPERFEPPPGVMPPPLPPLVAPPPTRLAAAAGPAALWARVRDAVTVRLALSRGGDALEETIQIVSGAPSPSAVQLPPATAPPVPVAAAQAVAAEPPPSTLALEAQDVELHGVRHSPAPVHAAVVSGDVREAPADARPSRWSSVVDERDAGAPVDPAEWNAFAASSYPTPDQAVDEPPAAPRPLGRHSRAVAREHIPLTTRMARLLGVAASALAAGGTSAAAAARAGGSKAVTRARTAVGGVSKAGPDNRMLAGIAAIGLIFVVALLIGRGSSHPAAPTATRPSTSAPTTHAQPSAPAHSGTAGSATGAPAAAQAQTFGAGGTGFQVIRLRYGAQAAYMRVVFDLGTASGNATGTARATVAFESPTSVLVTFAGTIPAGSTGRLPAGKLISSVTLVSSSNHQSVYRFRLTRPSRATAFYLIKPTRFVLDLH